MIVYGFLLTISVISADTTEEPSTKSVKYHWGEWSEWSVCSLPCGQGISNRTRHCNYIGSYTTNTDDEYCGDGGSSQHKLCTNKKCSYRSDDMRNKRCRELNIRTFHGRRYRWSVHIGRHKSCDLVCKTSSKGYMVRRSGHIADGSPCSTSTTDICLKGICHTVGCDKIIGSTVREDVCGVCGGNGKSCRVVKGLYTRPYTSRGYTHVATIPRDAWRVNVTELRRSRNYLALRIVDGAYIFNGHWRPSHIRTYKLGKMTIMYARRLGPHCPAQCIFIDKPISEPLQLQLLSFSTNPGVKYTYVIPAGRSLPDDGILNDLNVDANRSHHTAALDRIPRHKRPRNVDKRRESHQKRDKSTRYRRPEIIQNSRKSSYIVRVKPRSDYRRGYSRAYDTRDDKNGLKYSSVSGISGTMSYKPRSHARWGTPSERGVSRVLSYRPTSHDGKITSTRNQSQSRSFKAKSRVRSYRPTSRDYMASHKRRSSYSWKVSGLTSCSKTCGGGIQRTNVICVDAFTHAIVTNENCESATKPDSPTVICNNVPCPPGWANGEWSECSSSCGPGVESRRVRCEQVVSATLILAVKHGKCNRRTKPPARRRCKREPCARWSIGEWTNCSAECGHGQRSRKVNCVDPLDAAVDEAQCILLGEKPEVLEVCDMGSCAKAWFHTQWTKTCSARCGRGHVTRLTFCSADDGTKLTESKCQDRKPTTKKTCKTHKPCGGQWFTGQWGSCSATCGDARKTRAVICVKLIHSGFFTVVSEVNCEGKVKPDYTEPCEDLAECPPTWYMTDWSNCSVPCGAGYKTREVKCLTPSLTTTLSCDPKTRPLTRRGCNVHSCDKPQLDNDPSCLENDEQFCVVVVQARMCKYDLYRRLCCHSCARKV